MADEKKMALRAFQCIAENEMGIEGIPFDELEDEIKDELIEYGKVLGWDEERIKRVYNGEEFP